MAVSIKSEREIELMRQAGKILAKVHDELGKAIRPGISTLEIDQLGERLIRGFDCIPNFLNYHAHSFESRCSVRTLRKSQQFELFIFAYLSICLTLSCCK